MVPSSSPWWTRWLRRYLVGAEQEFTFHPVRDVQLPQIKSAGLYLHVPFCKSLCPYCPYNKIAYADSWVEPYVQAVLREIEEVYRRLGSIDITSIYIGGGTPTHIADKLGTILEYAAYRFRLTGPVCIETNPMDLESGFVAAEQLKSMGIKRISLGVQSFDERCLSLLGRKYSAQILPPTLRSLVQAGFETVNVDLMFALPDQREEDVLTDIAKSISLGVDQVTLYPLFTFPYTTVGKYRAIKKVKMPDLTVRRRMYKRIHDYFLQQGWHRVSVWGFAREQAPRYSSVTRDEYIGLGPGAGSHLPGLFYINTFSVEAYIQAMKQKERLPVAMSLRLNDSLSFYHWLYWRLYDTAIPIGPLEKQREKGDRRPLDLVRFLQWVKWAEVTEDFAILTEPGAFWLHLMQNYFALDYVNRIWSTAGETPWPEAINI
ncbi:radical SAM protein [Heliobacterium chlorum]|uniref:Heme chaperone HemW n=1 Tax=Heliobacterium chlorum TaxID=2698 RepID=A0ABR7T554_HELCL|nr:coproporphyrinogen-III oxidase family protein [Heliobacterium chlorum]MBC9785212.1 radical SAM protein [Heliobacterium chlorum]